MALTVTQLNGDASFLLALEPPISDPSSKPFYIILDPWLTGSSTILHSKISITAHKDRGSIQSLLDLPEPDLVIISQNRADHLNPATLRQLPPRGTKTLILAEPSSARTIRRWNYFEDGKVVTIPKWDHRKSPRVIHIPILNGDAPSRKPGEVTVAFIPQRHDISGLHSAVAITYRPPIFRQRTSGIVLTPPMTPGSDKSSTYFRVINAMADPLMPPAPTTSLSTKRYSCHSTRSLSALDRPLSIIFSPHGIKYSSLHSYVTRHLVSEAALPLTALLHCFDTVSSRWFGDVLLGAPSGVEIAMRLGAKSWFSTHDDGNKMSGGVLNRILKTTRFCREEILRQLNLPEPSMVSNTTASKYLSGPEAKTTGVFAPAIGDPITVSGEGIHGQVIEIPEPQASRRPKAHRRGESWLDLEEEDPDESSLSSPREASSFAKFEGTGDNTF
jgi:hypothetical protein